MDKSHFNTFIFSNSDKIYHYVYSLVRDQKETLDIVALTIEECWEKRKTFSHTNMIFVFKIARKLARLRIANYDHKKVLNYDNNLVNANPLLVRFCSLTQDLSPLQAEVMSLRAMVGFDIDDISIVVEQGINNVQSILAVVRKAIRARINPTIVVPDLKTNEVLLKYYSGKSSLKEEEQLRLYFSRMDLSDATGADRELFELFIKVGNAPMPTICADHLLRRIKEMQTTNWWTSLTHIFS
jgi:DNA-directed RNA polymerase specialized sigma24 family protein